MAFDSSKLKEWMKPITEFQFSKLNSRARILVIIGGMAGIVLLMYFIANHFFGGGGAGTATVATAPSGLKTLPGAKVTPEYERVIREVEQQRTHQAQLTGTSSIGTISNVSNNAQGQCNIICSDQAVNVKNTLDDWSRRGEISDEVAADLQQLANKGVSVDEYAARLNQLVKEGKLTPEQARELLAQYKKQHANMLLQESAKNMDDLIKSGKLPLDVANQLLQMQKDGMTAAQYAAYLDQLVKEGKISPEVAQQLLAQYSQQRTQQVIERSIAFIRQLANDGKLTKEVADALIPLEMKFVPLPDFTSAVQNFTASGKLIPATAKQLIDEYAQQKAEVGGSDTLMQLLKNAEDAAYAEIAQLEQSKQMTPEVANQLRSLIKQDVPLQDFEAFITQLVQQNKMTPEIAKQKIADYRRVKGLRDLTRELNGAASNNATVQDYADRLRKAVQAGLLTPEEAARLLREYQASLAVPTVGAPAPAATEAFAALQKELAGGAQAAAPTEQFVQASAAAQQVSEQDRSALIQTIMGTMSAQAQQLIAGWQPTPMLFKTGNEGQSRGGRGGREGEGERRRSKEEIAQAAANTPAVIKAGTILYGVLDTEVNSDYKDSPAMVTIVQGPYKGAKLLGKLVTAAGVSGQQDRISLNFTTMNMDAWPRSKTITASAIDPDSARTVFASEVDYHYLQRFGAIMATSFVAGYANAIQSSGATTSTSGFFTNTTNPPLSPSDKIKVGIGNIGTTLGSVTQNYVNIPPTVKINAGVSVGVIFMQDLTS